MKIDTRKQSTSHVGWAPLGASAEIQDAIKKGKHLRIDCNTCGRRYFDLKSAVLVRKARSYWSRDDIRKKFTCVQKGNPACKIGYVAFEVRLCDVETFQPRTKK